MLLTLYINNKAGGLIYHRDFAAHAAKLDTNDHLRLASTFSGLALIMKQLSPIKGSSQMVDLECDGFVLQSFDTLTGLKFFLTGVRMPLCRLCGWREPKHTHSDSFSVCVCVCACSP